MEISPGTVLSYDRAPAGMCSRRGQSGVEETPDHGRRRQGAGTRMDGTPARIVEAS